MKDESVDIAGLGATIALFATACLLFTLMVLTDMFLSVNTLKAAEPPEAVLNFLHEFIPLRSTVEQENTLEKYFSCVDTTSIMHDGSSQDLLSVNAVFTPELADAVDFRVCSIKKNYIEFMPLDADGNDLPCRVGFFYRIGGDGRICSYSLTRLQPVSRWDEEWSEVWQ